MDYGLALSGGGIRGAAHVGILKALEEEGLLPTHIAGTSAGGIVAGLYASGLDLDKMCGVVQYLSRRSIRLLDPDFFGIIRLIPQILIGKEVSLTGFLKGKKLIKLLCLLTNNLSLYDVSTKIIIPAVDIISGNTIAFTNIPFTNPVEDVIWKRHGRLCEVMMASSSVPGIFHPVTMGNFSLVGGGVTNNFPANLLLEANQKKVISVDIGVDYETPHNHSITEIVSHSFSIMSNSLKNCISQKELLVLKPPLHKGAGLLTFNYMELCMNDGYFYAKKMMPKIKEVISQ